jgi:hypothetical protein
MVYKFPMVSSKTQQYRNLLIYFLKTSKAFFITGNSLIGFAKLIFIVGFVAI